MVREPEESVVDSEIEEPEWRSLHPLTPLANAWAVFAAIFAFAFYYSSDILSAITDFGLLQTYGLVSVVLIGAGIALIVAIVSVIYSWLSWRRMGYAITSEAVFYRVGVVFHAQFHARLDRIQAVSITHPLIGRMFSLGRINIEVAGGTGSSFHIGLLKSEQLEQVRREVLAEARAAKLRNQAELGTSQDLSLPPFEQDDRAGNLQTSGLQVAPASDLAKLNQGSLGGALLDEDELEVPIYRVRTGTLAASMLTSIGLLLMSLAGLLAAAGAMAGYLLSDSSPAGLLPVALGCLAIFAYPFNKFAQDFNFNTAVTSDGIRVRAGLLSTRSQTIPVRRVHAVKVSQRFLWRFFGWYRVEIVQAGFSADPTDEVDHSTLLPVGSREEMLQALWMVYPDLGVSNPVETIMTGLEAQGPMLGFSQNPKRSRIFDPLTWQRKGVKLTDAAALFRHGRLVRRFSVVSYDRLQSIRVTQGPWDRRRGLASINLHLVELFSRSNIDHLDERQAREICYEIAQKALISRQKESQEEWLRRAVPGAKDRSEVYASREESTT